METTSKIFGLSRRQLFISVGLILVFASGIYCSSGDPQVKTFNLSIVEQKLEGQDSNLPVNQDDYVNIVIHSDKDVLFHLHGYDIEKLVRMDEPTNINFFANATGSFPFTIHYGKTISEHAYEVIGGDVSVIKQSYFPQNNVTTLILPESKPIQ